MKKLLTTIVLACTAILVFSQERPELSRESNFIGYSHYIDGVRMNRPQFEEQLSVDIEAYKEYKSGKKMNAYGTLISSVFAIPFGMGLAAVIVNSSSDRETTDIQRNFLTIGGLGFLVGTGLSLAGNGKIKEAINLHNRGAKSSLQFGPSKNGVGITLNF